ncbi:MAG: hypothetical protein A3A51_05060 [Candidatus Levybacteria bacterium RIFCSPLOWO2_01_FULL_39_10]|nr:MAG: hypothetical protein A3A51_05060 [Candidatus Levybacteria bacterium RIFCSPLOWO2_01_FULL_39_10]
MASNVFDEIKEAIISLKWGSVEVIVQDGQVTQISTRIIKKTTSQTDQKSAKNIKKSDKTGINLNFKY